MTTTTETPRIYVACLASYNAGTLHGVWIDADQDLETIHDEINDMLTDSPEPNAEEWAIHDYEYMIDLGENPTLDDIVEHGEQIAEHGNAWIAYAELVGMKYATPDGFEEAFQGGHDSEQAFAEEYFDNCEDAKIPSHLMRHFDFESYASELFMGDYSSMLFGGVTYVFSNC